MEFVSTATETEALLLEANLIKRLRPRFNVLLRDDKSFPYILLTADHPSPQLCKHRGARNRKGDYFGPFASVWAVNRTITALERAFLVRSCSDAVFESRTRPCLLHQIKRCAAPCTGEIAPEAYDELVREARAFLSGRSRAVKDQLATEMETASNRARLRAGGRFARPACGALRDPVATRHQPARGRRSRRVRGSSERRLHLYRGLLLSRRSELGQPRVFSKGRPLARRRPKCWANSWRSSMTTSRVRARSSCRTTLRIGTAGRSVEHQAGPQGRDARAAVAARRNSYVDQAAANAREALGRKLADTASQQRLLRGSTGAFGLATPPNRDRGLRQQPHPGQQRGRRHGRGRAGRVSQKPVPQVQHQVGDLARRR